jgi:hypothetical protein
MKNPERRSRSNSKTAGGPGILRRWLDSLRELVNQRQLVPVPVSAPTPGPFRRRDPEPPSDGIYRVFGRRKDEAPKEDSDSSDGKVEEGGALEDAAGGDQLDEHIPPIPSAQGPSGEDEAEDSDESDETEVHSPEASSLVGSSWSSSVPESDPVEPSPFSYEPPADQADLPAWTPTTSPVSDFPTFSPETEAEPTPWAGGPDDDSDELTSYSPVAAQSTPLGDDQPWAAATADSPWPVGHEEEAPESQFVNSSFNDQEAASEEAQTQEEEEEAATYDEPGQVADAVAIEEVEDAAEEEGLSPSFETEPIPEVVAVSEGAWSVSTSEPEPSYVTVPSDPERSVHLGAVALVEDARAFPLPEGEVIFRNLRSGFTDPARLLRHLAGEGHTGVMHVAGADERNTYIVLVDGYVVAVASDSGGRLTTTNRVSFPNFPNSQDTLNVISYEREIARGLGLLLHAPVHFRGLGAMFVNLDGLRSYLSKRSASGGMVVQSDTGTGVALFDDGRLVGVYSGSGSPGTDLAPLRELIKDLDAEIDVRFGGPKDLDPVSLDTLLAGYPL